MGCASRCPGPPPVGRAMPGPASQVLHSHEVVAICCSVLAWQIATTFLKYRPGNGRDLPLCSSVANHDHFFGLFKRKMVAKCHVCTEWHFATSPRDQPTRPAHATSPRDQPTRPAHATSPRDQPTRPAHGTSLQRGWAVLEGLPFVRGGLSSLTSRTPPPWQRRPRGACWPRGRS